MNIEKLEQVLHEMQAEQFADLPTAHRLVREWAERINGAITAHLLAELGGGLPIPAPALATDPSGHDWEVES
jgi:hypothetical protein